MKSFFVSYNQHDRAWAEWIAWHLEENDFTVVIQAWDFIGNWVMKMDKAMRETERTIIVLSPHYVEAMFTQPEWADAFRRDPTGDKDLLIPVRVESVEPQAILAQIVYVDLVGKKEPEALELLLRRARGERGKPSVRPPMPGSGVPSQTKHSTAARPVYPAAAEDQQQFLQARDAIVRWRGLYSAKLEMLRVAGERARAWSKELPEELDDNVGEVIGLAEKAAQDFSALPIRMLEFARPYGLNIHPTVFWGNALDDVTASAKSFAWEKSDEHKQFELIRAQQGVKPFHSLVLNNYGFEMIARVLESALELARFNPEALPRGYLKPRTGPEPSEHKACPSDLRGYGILVLARIDNDPKLHLLSPEAESPATEMKILGSFAARSLKLFALSGRKNREGSLDLVAHDFEHLYYWQGSNPQPTMEFRIPHVVQDARFLSADTGSPVAVVDSEGTVETVTLEGGRTELHKPKGNYHQADARIWFDPEDRKSWFVITLTNDWTVSSGLQGVPSSTRTQEELWGDPFFEDKFGPGSPFWHGYHRDLAFGTLNGLPCLMVTRIAGGGAGICFLDPKTLVSIRLPVAIPGFVGEVKIVGGRWLLAAMLKNENVPQNRLVVWDLGTDDHAPIGAWLEEVGDVYHVITVEETANSFETLQVFRTLEIPPYENFFQMIRFGWPSGKITRFHRCQDLRIWPVEYIEE